MTKNELQWFEDHFETLRREVVKLQVAVAVLKVKAGIWGLVGGAIPIAIGIGVYFLTRGIGS